MIALEYSSLKALKKNFRQISLKKLKMVASHLEATSQSEKMPCGKCKQNGHNRRTCQSSDSSSSASDVLPDSALPAKDVAPDSNPPRTEATPGPLPENLWVCPACDLPLGNDHRMCICRAFNYSVDAWEKGCEEYGRKIHGL